jgi:uncharacterized protein (TIGR04255 family)
MPEPETFQRLQKPPIDEVVCGFVFEPVPGLTAMDFGVYGETRRADFPGRALHPALSDKISLLHMGPPPVRAWLISPSDEIVLQLQNDRFYTNWRARGGEYPRFRDRGETRGVKRIALEEFHRFAEFCCARAKLDKLSVSRIELTKVDKLVRGKHWDSYADLGSVLRVVTVFDDIKSAEPKQLNLTLNEADDDSALTTVIAVDETVAKIESTIRVTVSGDLEPLLDRANERLNRVFFGLVSATGLKRFSGEA